jgi:hypothetical protein
MGLASLNSESLFVSQRFCLFTVVFLPTLHSTCRAGLLPPLVLWILGQIRSGFHRLLWYLVLWPSALIATSGPAQIPLHSLTSCLKSTTLPESCNFFHQSAFIYPDLPFALSTLANSVPLIFIAHWTIPVFAFCSH